MEETPGTTSSIKRKRKEDHGDPMRRDDSRDNRRPDERKVEEPRGYTNFTLLNVRLVEVLEIAEEKDMVTPFRPIKESAKRQWSDKYCRFYKDKGHTTEDCQQNIYYMDILKKRKMSHTFN